MLPFYKIEIGSSQKAQLDILDRLKKRLQLRQVDAVEQCDVILAFESVVSDAGTDQVPGAISKLQTSRPVILLKLHHTIDEHSVPRSSGHHVQDNVMSVDCLIHKDVGLLRCQSNDEALKAITEHMIHLGGTLAIPMEESDEYLQDCSCSRDVHVGVGVMLLVIFLVVIMLLSYYFHPRREHGVFGRN